MSSIDQQCIARVSRVLLFAFVTLLAACGGGGGGGDDGPAPIVESPQSSLPLSLTPELQRPALTVTSVYAESVLALALDASDWVRDFSRVPSASATGSCLGGSRSWAWTDGNGNGRVDGGDNLTLTLAQCGAPASALSLTGVVSIALEPGSTADALQLLLSFDPPTGLGFEAGEAAFAWQGRMTVERSVSPTRDRLVARAAFADRLRIELRGEGVAVSDRFEAVSLSREINDDHQGTSTNLSLTVSSDVLKGRVSLETTLPLFAYFDTYPIEGDLELFGVGRVMLRAHPDGLRSGTFFVLEGDASQSGLPMAWSEVMAGLAFVGPGGPLPQRYAGVQEVGAVPFAFLVGVPAQIEPTARRYAFQLNRMPTLQGPMPARLYRQGEGWGPATIEARALVRDTHVELSWDVQPEPGASYRVELIDASTQQAVVLRDRWDQRATVLPVPELLVADSFLAGIATDARLRLLPGTPVRLRAASGSDGTPVQFRWRQIGGAIPVQLSAVDQPEVDVTVQPGLIDPGTVTLELEATDARGVVDRRSVALTAVPSPPTSWLVQVDGSPGDPYLNGTRVFAAWPQPNLPAETLVRWVDASPTPYLRAIAGVSSSVTTSVFLFFSLPPGVPLQPGTYAANSSLYDRVDTASMHFVTDLHAPICRPQAATFTVHEAALGEPDGSVDGRPVERLAIDYEYACAGTPPVRGALRLRSAVPLPP